MTIQGRLRDLVDGFFEKVPGDEVEYPDMPVQNMDDHKDYEPDDESEKTEAEPVRLINNALDFIYGVVEEVHEWAERELGEGHRPPDVSAKPLVIRTFDQPASDFSVRRYSVTNTGGVPLGFKNASRKVMRLVNWGPDPVYIAHESGVNFSAAAQIPINVMVIPASNATVVGQYYPVLLPTQDEVWAYAGAATACVVEVSDFYGVLNA